MKKFALLFHFIFALFLTGMQLTHAQSFPVQVIPQALPPAPIYFSDYADESTVTSPLRVQLILNDLQVASKEVRLKASFEGNGIAFESNAIVSGAPLLFLESGIPLNLTNVELSPYFKFENIVGISPNVYGQPIPEGTYRFCFEVFDAFSGNRISDRTCAGTIIFQNDPPILIAPLNKSVVEERNPQNIVFQWTPRHINVSNVEYELSIVEIWDNQIDHQAAFLSSPPIFQTTTTATTYLYGPADPQLLSDKNYAWRVQAKAKQGAEEIGLFKNQGYSTIFVFGNTGNCDLPIGINHEVKGSTNANIFWDDITSDAPEFQVRYRQTGGNYDWFYSKTTANLVTLWDLQAGTEYEYQLAKTCALAESEYSPIKTFRTNLFDDDDSAYECGIAPDIDVTNETPLANLNTGEKFTAGDFPVTVTEANGSNGYFNGKGYVTIPYLKSIKVAVEFTNIFINELRELKQGNVITVFDPNMSGIIDPWGFVNDVDGIINGGDSVVLPPVDFEIESVTVSGDKIIITGVDSGNNPVTVEYEYDENDTYIVTGENTAYSIDENGNVNEIGPMDADGPATVENTAGLQSGGNGTTDNPSVATIDDSKIQIKYLEKSNAKYGFDHQNSPYEADTYTKAALKSGGDFFPIHKAVKNGETDSFIIEVTITDADLILEDLIFKTVSGIKIETTALSGKANQLQVNLKGAGGYRNEEAIITYKDEEEKHIVVGSFFVHHLRPVGKIDVEVITVNGASMPSGLSNIAQKFVAAGADIGVTAGQNFQGNASTLSYTDSGLLRKLPDSFRAFANDFKNNSGNYSRNKYYVFVFDNSVDPGSIAGFMPRKTQYGFVFPGNLKPGNQESKNTVEDLIAHEIGHGVFGISHPADNNLGTDWIMDKGDGKHLAKRDWEAIGDKGLQLYLFDDDEDAEFSKYLNYRCILPSISKPKNNETYYSSKGHLIFLNSKYEPFAFVGSEDDHGNKRGGVAIIRRKSDKKLFWPAQSASYTHFYARIGNTSKIDITDFINVKGGYSNDVLEVLIDDDCSYIIKRAGTDISPNTQLSSCKCFGDSDEEGTGLGSGKISTELGANSEIAERISDTNVSPDESFDSTQKLIDRAGIFTSSEKMEIIDELNQLSNDHKVIILDSTPTDQELQDILNQINTSDKSVITVATVTKDSNGNDVLNTITDTRSNLSENNKSRYRELTKELLEEYSRDFGKGSINFFKSRLIGDAQLLQFISDLLENIKVPEKYWNPKHVEYPAQMPIITRILNIGTGDFFSIFESTKNNQMKFAFKTGLWNGVVDEVKGLVDLTQLASDYFLDKEKRKEINESFKQLTIEKIWSSFEQAHGYEDGQITNQFKLSHQLGKDVIFVASFFTGVGAITKAGKISKITDVAKLVSNGAIKFIKQLPKKIREFVSNLPQNISKTMANGYLVLRLNTLKIVEISEQGVFRRINWIDEGKVLKLTNDELAVLTGAKYYETFVDTDILILIERGKTVGFKVVNTIDAPVKKIAETFIEAMPAQFISKSGIKVAKASNKTTTILGNYRKDIQHILKELKYPKTEDFGPKVGGYNLLNVPDKLYETAEQFWKQYNKPFLDAVIARGDEIVLVTKPTDEVLNIFDETGNIIGRSGFGKEYDYLISKGYRYDEVSSKMIKGRLGSFNIPKGLGSKLGNKLPILEDWLTKNIKALGDDYAKLLGDLELNLGTKEVQNIFEDANGRLVVLTKSDNATRVVATLEKVVTGKIKSFKFTNAYNKAGQPGKPPLSVNGMTPDFSGNPNWLFPVIGNQKNIVKIKLTGKRNGIDGDFDLANKAANIQDLVPSGKWKPDNYTWHHMDDFDPITGESTMQLVKTIDHQGATPHVGSAKQYENFNNETYK